MGVNCELNYLAQDRDQRQGLVNTAMNFRVLEQIVSACKNFPPWSWLVVVFVRGSRILFLIGNSCYCNWGPLIPPCSGVSLITNTDRTSRFVSFQYKQTELFLLYIGVNIFTHKAGQRKSSVCYFQHPESSFIMCIQVSETPTITKPMSKSPRLSEPQNLSLYSGWLRAGR
jgi:hypothetical protein